VRAFADMSGQASGVLGSFNTNAGLIDFEVKAIEQGRLCHLDSYASYCAYVGLDRPKAFSDISKNKAAVDFLAEHYAKPDDVDFYVGLFAEESVKNSPLPPLILRMVAVDAFSQALTNPLLSEHVYKSETFSEVGWEVIQRTASLRDVLEHQGGAGGATISMTLGDWKSA
jgi:prostaglandin-endoperoxide synthase 2